MPVLLVGLHVRKNGKLPSNETISEVVDKCKTKIGTGLIIACVSPEIIENSVKEVKKLNIPYGYKANLWKVEDLFQFTNLLHLVIKLEQILLNLWGQEMITLIIVLEFSKNVK